MSIGMTFDQYWYGDVRMTSAFVEADRLRQERMNTELWLQGLYYYDAVCCALKNAFRQKNSPPAKYAEKPYDIFGKEKQENLIDDGMTKEEREILIAKIMLDNERRASKQRQNWGGSK